MVRNSLNISLVENTARIETIVRRMVSLPDGTSRFARKSEESQNFRLTEPQPVEISDSEWTIGLFKTALTPQLGRWVFGLMLIAAGLITALIVGYESLKAARTNPVKSLRAE